MQDKLRSFTYRMTRGRIYLPGLWERVGDSFAGCGVLIEKGPHGFQGRITYVPARMRHYGWRVGDVKWKSFTPARLFAYHVHEQYKEYDHHLGRINNVGFVTAHIGFISPDEIVVFPRGQRGVQKTRWYRSGKIHSD